MPSIIPGYEYDIFISYRQKDNKGDKWVSEFVEALKTELESTFKEDVSVYFDINPSDYLLGTYDVDASLKDKLKCLVFIPIISRTYCDPRSFAWEHEFKAFVEQAGKDKFGLKVKLPNGNVANRVLPVHIHNLDNADIKEFESALGGVLRGVEFIYKEPGVDKPLAPGDNEKKNLNNTIYRIQIIKVAHAIKELILGMKAEPASLINDKARLTEPSEKVPKETIEEIKGKPFRSTLSKLFPVIIIATILVIAAMLFYPKIFKQDKFKEIRDPNGKISVAVMPFENLTGDTTLNWFRKGISSLIINGLGNSSELAVCDDQTMFEVMESMNQLSAAGISPSLEREIADKVKAETYISGSFQGSEDTYRIMVNLVNAETGNIIWTNKVEGNLKSSAYLDLADSLCNEIKNYLEIKALENIADYDFREAYPKSAEAYRYFIEGMNLVLNQNYESGILSFTKALEIDSAFTFASFYIAYSYCYNSQFEQTVLWTKKTYACKDRVPPKYQIWIELWYACYISKNLQDVNRYCDLLAGSGINTRLFWSDLGVTYIDFLRQYEKAVAACEKVMELNLERGGEWKFTLFWDRFIIALHKSGNHQREKEISDIALSYIPNNSNWIYYRMIVCNLSQGKTKEANEILVKYKAKHKEIGTPDQLVELWICQMNEEANILDEAEIHFRRWYEQSPQKSGRMYQLARFLIYNDINTEEGMGLINNALESLPEDEDYLHLKGWGLYKQGKYEEAEKLLGTLWEKNVAFNSDLYYHLKAAKDAVASKKRTDR